jgi:beta-glucosidase
MSTGVSAGPQFIATFDVTNTGKQSGAEVAQVYVGAKSAKVPEPVKQLKGFARVNLQPGETQKVSVPLDGRSFAYYDVASKEWKADAGAYSVLVGDSSDHIALTGNVDLPATVAIK